MIICRFEMRFADLGPVVVKTRDLRLHIVFIGNSSSLSVITQGDEELIAILASQIGQTLENVIQIELVHKGEI